MTSLAANMEPPPLPPDFSTSITSSADPPVGGYSGIEATRSLLASQRLLREQILDIVVKVRPDIVANFRRQQACKARARAQARATKTARLGGVAACMADVVEEQVIRVADTEAFDLYICALPAPDDWPRDGAGNRPVIVLVGKVMCWGRLLSDAVREVECGGMGKGPRGRDCSVVLYEADMRGSEGEAMEELFWLVRDKSWEVDGNA